VFRFKFDIEEVVSQGSFQDVLVVLVLVVGFDSDHDEFEVQSCFCCCCCCVFSVPIPRNAFKAFEESTSRVGCGCVVVLIGLVNPPIAQIDGPFNIAGSEAYLKKICVYLSDDNKCC
jgi:hypothetical protein